jgi:hypothetical protein
MAFTSGKSGCVTITSFWPRPARAGQQGVGANFRLGVFMSWASVILLYTPVKRRTKKRTKITGQLSCHGMLNWLNT